MVVNSLQSDASRSERVIARSLGYDFALLGLPVREARVQVIRTAAQSVAARIHDAAVDDRDLDGMLSDLVISTYRLLDPRKRSRMLERVQLCIMSEEDLQLQERSRTPMVTAKDSIAKDSLVTAVLVDSGQGEAPPDTTVEAVLVVSHPPQNAEKPRLSRFGRGSLNRLTFSVLAVICGSALTLGILSAV